MDSLRRQAAGLLIVAALLAALILSAPFAIAVYSVMLLGPLHVLLAVRYLGGRIAGAIPASTGWLLVILVATMSLVRAVATVAPHLGHRLELLGGMALLAFALALGLRGRMRYLAVLPVVLVAIVSFAELPWYWHLLTHGHNIVPLIFLWDWTRGRSPGHRLAFVGANLVWLIGVPVAILLGLADPLLNNAQPDSVAHLVDPRVLIASVAPPGADPGLGLRFLAIFAFLQAMHYVLWMVFFQLCPSPRSSRSTLGSHHQPGVPEARRTRAWGHTDAQRFPLAGWRFWALTAGVTAVIWTAYASSYYNGRAAYGVLGAFNVYLEQPIAVWLLLTALPASATSALVGRLRE